MICFDMRTTVMKQFDGLCQSENSDYRDNHNVIGTSTMTVKKAWQVFGGLFAVAAVVGIILVARTNILFTHCRRNLFLHRCVLYIWTHSDFSDAPWEVLSGFYMGFGIFLDYGIFKCARRERFLQGHS